MPKPWLEVLRTGHFANQPDHAMVREHPKDHLLIWVLAGRGYARLGRQKVLAGPGDLLCFPKGKPHAYGSDRTDPWDIVWAHFDGHFADKFMKQIAPEGQLKVSLGLDLILRGRFEELLLHFNMPALAHREFCHCLLGAILGHMVYRLSQPPASGQERWLTLSRDIQHYVQEHLTDPLTMEDLAKLAGVSPRQLSRLFHQLFQTSPMHYVNQQRLVRAATMLSETDWSVKRIALEVGFTDPYYFSRLFGRQMHLSPSQWRNRSRH